MVNPTSSLGTTKPNHLLKPPTATIKFLSSYGGKILPRYPDGKLRYLGGQTRVLAVHRSISFSELLSKLREMCGTLVTLRCQLPTEDLDALISITCDEDLANLIEEYDRVSPPPSSLKIRAFLSLPKKPSPPPSSRSSSSSSSSSSTTPSLPAPPPSNRCLRQVSAAPQVAVPFWSEKYAGKVHHYGYHAHGNPPHIYLIHNGNHWQ